EVFHDYRVLLRGASGQDSVMSFSGAPVHDDQDSVEGAVVVFRDVTTSQKLERAKDDFLAVAAHELRSPLAAVRGYTDLLARHPAYASRNAPARQALSDGDELMAVIQVRDQGAGISAEQAARLFKRYARGQERHGEGLGLGLYLSREFVTRHGGEIWVESQD